VRTRRELAATLLVDVVERDRTETPPLTLMPNRS
jgi:hypothetical protein